MVKVVALILLLYCSAELLAQDKWELRIDQDSIRVYTAHTDESKIKVIRADFTIRAARDELFRELLQAERYVEWQYNAERCEVIDVVSGSEILYYCEVSAPWPVSNRDLVIRLKIINDPESPSFRITTLSDPKPYPGPKDVVRVPMSRGEWLVTEVGPRMLKVRYTMRIDPGGSIPAWLVNLVAAQAPFQTFKNLKQRLEH